MGTAAFRFAALLVATGLAACGGGGSSGSAAAPMGELPNSSGTLTLTIPRSVTSAHARSPLFVSPNAASIVVTVKTVNGQAPTAAQVPPSQNPSTTALSTAAGGNCTVVPAGETCTVSIPAPTGSVVYQFDLLAANSTKIGTVTATFQIQPGANALAAQMQGIVATVTVTAPGLHKGTAFSGPITVQAFDASGALIVGSAAYAFTFTLTDNDATAHTSLTNNATTAKTVTVLTPNDVVILNYDGANIPSFTITAANGNGPNPVTGTVTVTVGP